MAAYSVVYFGLRWEIDYRSPEIDALSNKDDPRVKGLRRLGLQFDWGKTSDEKVYVLLVGVRLTSLGVEEEESVSLSFTDLQSKVSDVRAKLKELGLDGEPQLHMQFYTDW